MSIKNYLFMLILKNLRWTPPEQLFNLISTRWEKKIDTSFGLYSHQIFLHASTNLPIRGNNHTLNPLNWFIIWHRNILISETTECDIGGLGQWIWLSIQSGNGQHPCGRGRNRRPCILSKPRAWNHYLSVSSDWSQLRCARCRIRRVATSGIGSYHW